MTDFENGQMLRPYRVLDLPMKNRDVVDLLNYAGVFYG